MKEVKRLVVDTSVVVHLLRKTPKEGQEDQWRSANRLDQVEADEWQLCIAAPALAEVLCGLPAPKRAAAIRFLQRMFEVLCLDADAAAVAGDLGAGAIGRRPQSVTRQQVKVDVLILACAVRWNAGGVLF